MVALALLGALCLPNTARAVTRDVYPSGASSTNDTDLNNIQGALDNASAGDTIVLHGGDYYPSMHDGNNNLLMMNRNGGAGTGNWITITSDGNTPRLHLDGSASSTGGLSIFNCSFIRIERLELIGNPNANPNSQNSFQGLNLIGHDFQVVNCTIYNFGGSGTNSPDRTMIRNCDIHDNAGQEQDGGSGITVGFPSGGNDDLSHFATDNNENRNGGPNQPNAYGIVVVNNNCWRNAMQVDEYEFTTDPPTYIGRLDGNGIIVDTTTRNNYPHRVLIANNVCFLNGSNGIAIFKSTNVDVYNNTCYHNSQAFFNPGDTIPGDVNSGAKEILLGNGNNNNGFNNICVASGSGNNVNGFIVDEGGDNYGNNISYCDTGANINYTMGDGDKNGQDPGFVDTGNGNFRLNAGSPAAGAGETGSQASTGVTYDHETASRNGTIDIGAYVVPGGGSGDPSDLTAS